MSYVIGDIIKIKLATDWRHASPCTDLSTNSSLGLTIGYMDEVCQNYNKHQLLSLNTK